MCPQQSGPDVTQGWSQSSENFLGVFALLLCPFLYVTRQEGGDRVCVVQPYPQC